MWVLLRLSLVELKIILLECNYKCILKISEEMFDAHMLVNLVQFPGIIVTYTVSLSYI